MKYKNKNQSPTPLLALVFAIFMMGCIDPTPVYASYTPSAEATEPRAREERAPHAHEERVDPPPRHSPVTLASKKKRGKERRDPAPSPTPSSEPQKLNINAATAAQLEALPGIGPALAKRIIDARSRRPFTRTSHLKRVKGIGPSTYKKLAPLITVEEEQVIDRDATKN